METIHIFLCRNINAFVMILFLDENDDFTNISKNSGQRYALMTVVTI